MGIKENVEKPIKAKRKILCIDYAGNYQSAEVANFKSNTGVFSIFYQPTNFRLRLIIIIAASIVSGLVSLLLIQNTGVYTNGFAGVVQGISRIIRVELLLSGVPSDIADTIYSLFFYGLNVLLNIPLLLIAWKKIGRKFAILTSVVIFVAAVFPFTLSFIPGVNELFLFGTVTSEDPVLSGLNSNFGIFLVTFNNIDNSKFISLFIYTLLAAVLQGLTYALILTNNSSTGGTDIVSLYYSIYKNKSLTSTLFLLNVGTIIISVFLGSYLAAGIADGNFEYSRFFSQNLITALVYSLVASTLINRLFPKSKVVQLKVYTEHTLKVREHLYSKNFQHSLTINNTIGGYSLQSKQNIEIICFHIETPKLLQDIKAADPNSLIIISPVQGLYGTISVQKRVD